MNIEQLYSIFQEHPIVTTDSRDCPKGSIFFALRGENFDGNAYAQQALEQGCSYAVIDNDKSADKNDSRLILVEDTLATLQKLAQYHRRQLGTKIIGITGTNGKTTTKELVSAVLKKKFNVLYTQGNLNNHIGVPKTLLRLTTKHELAVIEMGANHPGEIRDLTNIVEPNFGIITNVGKAHLLGFGSFEGVIKTKGELFDYLRQTSGTAFINNDNSHLLSISNGLRLIRYGQDNAPDLTVKGTLTSCSPFLNFTWNERDISTQLIGAYNLDNALAAITIGQYFGVADCDICDALQEYAPSNNRSQLKRTADNTLIIDAYNANPTSMSAALHNFRKTEFTNKMCILGDMKELGEMSEEEHVKILQIINQSEFNTVWLVGEEFRHSLSKSNMSCNNIRTFSNSKEVIDHIHNEEKPQNFCILIKGSNSIRLFDIVEHL